MKEDSMNDHFEAEKMVRVNCEQFAEVLHELDRPGTPGAALREGALAHAEMCSRCGALVTESESLDFSLGQIAQETEELQAPPKIEAALLREFRREKSAASSRRLRWQLAALGAAAAALLALGLSFHRPRAAAPDKAPAVSASAIRPASSPKTKPSPDSRSSAAPAILNVQAKTARAPLAAEKTAAAENDATEYATAYMPLPYAYDPSGLEGGAVVRVVLPRAVLVSYGLPVEAMGVSDQVTADMVVSEDGTPQAIRLVRQANPPTDD
jgi:hypothetical protein